LNLPYSAEAAGRRPGAIDKNAGSFFGFDLDQNGRWIMVQFKKLLRYWVMRWSHLVQERADAVDPNWRGVFVGLIFIILICAAGLIAFPR
jgi:hypothetical protein